MSLSTSRKTVDRADFSQKGIGPPALILPDEVVDKMLIEYAAIISQLVTAGTKLEDSLVKLTEANLDDVRTAAYEGFDPIRVRAIAIAMMMAYRKTQDFKSGPYKEMNEKDFFTFILFTVVAVIQNQGTKLKNTQKVKDADRKRIEILFKIGFELNSQQTGAPPANVVTLQRLQSCFAMQYSKILAMYPFQDVLGENYISLPRCLKHPAAVSFLFNEKPSDKGHEYEGVDNLMKLWTEWKFDFAKKITPQNVKAPTEDEVMRFNQLAGQSNLYKEDDRRVNLIKLIKQEISEDVKSVIAERKEEGAKKVEWFRANMPNFIK